MSSDDLQKPYLSIVIPVYNEESRIGTTLIKLEEYMRAKAFQVEALLVLNNCTDGTENVIDSLENKPSSIKVFDMGILSEIGNTKGLAVKKGVLEAQGEYIAFIDADLATQFEEIDKLLLEAKNIDVVVGSRRTEGGVIELPQVWYRTLLGKMGNWLIQLLLLPGIKDTQCGCKLFSYEAAKNIFKNVTIGGWGFDIEVLAIARKLKYKIKEVGVRWHDVAGSKVHAKAYESTLIELFKITWKWRIR
jgi:dolichyl-phosphate beta-glucosyltransferase